MNVAFIIIILIIQVNKNDFFWVLHASIQEFRIMKTIQRKFNIQLILEINEKTMNDTQLFLAPPFILNFELDHS